MAQLFPTTVYFKQSQPGVRVLGKMCTLLTVRFLDLLHFHFYFRPKPLVVLSWCDLPSLRYGVSSRKLVLFYPSGR